jgi:hypothetical protein
VNNRIQDDFNFQLETFRACAMTEKLRFAAGGFLFVAAVLTSAALIFIFGALSLRGNSSVTGGYLVITVVSAFFLGRQKGERLRLNSMDAAVAVFAAATTIASFEHFNRSDFKEYMLLAINSIFAYAAARFLSNSVLSSIRLRLLQISTPLVAVACIVTAPNLVGETYARPFVFGFFHAATVFCITFGYMVIAYIYSDIEWRSKISLFFFALMMSATAVFVASTVRFVLIAIVVTALFSFGCSIYRSISIWRKVALVLVAVTFGIVIGTASRYSFVVKIDDQISNTGVFSGSAKPDQNVVKVERHDLAQSEAPPKSGGLHEGDTRPKIEALTKSGVLPKTDAPLKSDALPSSDALPRNGVPPAATVQTVDEPPSCNKTFDLNNSIAIRRALLDDAFFFLPKAGFFGFGLDSFARMSCFEGYQIHNSVLQAIVELGWIAGIALIVLIIIPLKQVLFRQQETDVNLLFLLSCIAFTALLSLTYGQISRELPLFLFLGAFAKAGSNPAIARGREASELTSSLSAPI